MTADRQQLRIWKEAVIGYWKILFLHLLGRDDENNH
jgi:hypothetical protein